MERVISLVQLAGIHHSDIGGDPRGGVVTYYQLPLRDDTSVPRDNLAFSACHTFYRGHSRSYQKLWFRQSYLANKCTNSNNIQDVPIGWDKIGPPAWKKDTST